MESSTLRDKIVCSGALIYARNTHRFLLLQKARGKHQGTWGLVGGTTIEGENPWQGLQREIVEEIGSLPSIIKTIPLETFVSNDAVFNFHTYLCLVDDEFVPVLSDEHCAWAWAILDQPPKPLHQGLKNSFSNKAMRTKLQTIFDLVRLI
jgi:8-oxo-dGTP pyrophosphatase MutT (NUDIX family)